VKWVVLIIPAILLFMIYPSMATPSVERWLETVEINQDLSGDMVIQMEISGKFTSLTIELPGEDISVVKNDSMDFGGVLEITREKGAITVTPNYFSENTWNGRVHLKTGDIVEKNDGLTYKRIFTAPVVRLGNGSETRADLREGAISTTIALPQNYAPVSYSPEPWKIIFQYGRMKVLWRGIGETTVTLTGEFSPFLKDYVSADNRIKAMKSMYESDERYREARTILSLSLGYFEEGDIKKAREYLNRSLELIEDINAGTATQQPSENSQKSGYGGAKETPGFQILMAVMILSLMLIFKRHRN